MNKTHTIIVLFFIPIIVNAQISVEKPSFLRFTQESTQLNKLHKTLNKILLNTVKDKAIDQYITQDQAILTLKTLHVVKTYHHQFKTDTTLVSHQLNNIYPINYKTYKLTINGFLSRPQKAPILLYSITLIAKNDEGNFKFSIPLKMRTQHWKSEKAGKITYYYQNNFNSKRANLFNTKNKTIANKFGLYPEALTMYMCNNYQDILKLRGINYSINENGLYRDGYGVVDNTIFSVMHNEDFSHDILHYYSGKVNKRHNRNWITEEGLAYYWGNAYYTDSNGKMIDYKKLKMFLKSYTQKYPKIDMYHLFENDLQIFQQFAPEVSTRSVIAAIIVEEVEKLKGKDGVLKLINAGRKERLKNFLRVTKKLIALDTDNFNKKIKEFLSEN